MSKLSPAQERVMKLLLAGQIAQQPFGSFIFIGNQHVCDVRTMMALEKKGAVEQYTRYYWRATEQAKREADEQ